MPWFRLTWVLLWIYTGLTILVLFKRSDFINLTVCTVALYMMFNTERNACLPAAAKRNSVFQK